MMRILSNLLVGLVMLAVGACAGIGPIPSPETSREKLAAAEISYGALLDQVGSLTAAGLIERGSSTADTVAVLLVETRAALDAWQTAPDDPSLAQFGLATISRLKLLLISLNQEAGRPLTGIDSGSILVGAMS